jgi:hypothetical protein
LFHRIRGLTLAAGFAKICRDPLLVPRPLAILILGDLCLDLDLDQQVWEATSVGQKLLGTLVSTSPLHTILDC